MSSVKRKAVVEERPNKKSKSTKVAKESKATKPPKEPREEYDSSDRRPVTKSVLVQDERAFPRGGASVLTPLEHRQIKAQAERDVLFEQRTGQVTGEDEADAELFERKQTQAPAKSKSKKQRDSHREFEKVEKRGIPIHGLTFKNLAVGSSVLGCVTAISSRDVSLALANNITGYVPITAISEILNTRIEKLLQEEEDEKENDEDDVDLKQLFHHGQWLRATVTATTSDSTAPGGQSKRHIELSVDPRQVNGGLDANDLPPNSMVQAAVRSVEDHGIVVDFGMADPNVKGFVSKKELGAAFDLEKVQEGQVMMCLVTGKGATGNVLKLSPDAGRFSAFAGGKSAPSLNEAPTVNAFQPGTAVDILITESGVSGVAGKIMGMVDVTADFVHSNCGPDVELSKKYKVGTKTKARIIWTLPKDDGDRKIGVSLLEHTIVLPPPSTKLAENASAKLRTHAAEIEQRLPLSAIVDDARITQVLPERGVFMLLPSLTGQPEKALTAFANLSQMSDTTIEAISASSGPFRTGSTHKARLTAFNPLDNVYYVALKQSILEQQFLRLEDVAIGAVVKGTVENLVLGAKGITGVVMKMSASVSGFIPEIHLSDTQLQHPERKFKEGASVTARVLSVDPEKRQIRLTAKKSIVNDEEHAVWQDYSKVEPGMTSQGVVTKLLPTGAIVQFFGNVRAFLPVAEMSDTYIERPEQHFRLGQALKVRILSVNPELEEMRVSCKDDKPLGTEQLDAWENIEGGEIISGKVVENTADSVSVELENGLKGVIRLGHASDSKDAKAEAALKKLHVGKTVSDLLVLGKLNRSRQLLLTKKPSMVADAKAGTTLRSFSDVREDMEVHGFVRNVTPEGIYVEFVIGLTGLLPKREILPEMLELPAFGFLKDHSIKAWVSKIEYASERFVLSMNKPPNTMEKSSAARTPLSNAVDTRITSVNDLTLGMVTKARIASVKSTQINVRIADNVQGRIDMSEVFDSWDDIQNKKCPLQKFQANEVLDVKILGIHDSKSHRFLPISHRQSTVPVFELTAKKSRLNGDESALTMNSLDNDGAYVAFINNHQESCVWANISPNVKGRIEFMDLSDRPGQVLDVAKNFPVGSALKVNVKKIDLEHNRLNLSASESSQETLTLEDINPGMILAGRITKISERSLNIYLAENLFGTVSLTELSDDYDALKLSEHKKNDIVRVSVLDVDAPNKRIYLSLRPSKVLSSSLPVKDKQVSRHEQLKTGDLVRGFVQNIGDNAVYIQLGARVIAMARITNLSDEYVNDWKSLYQVDQMVTGRVIFVDADAKQVHLSLKASHVDKSYTPPVQIADLKPGSIVTGKVRKVEEFGAFIDIDGTRPRLSGLCHRSEMAAQRVEDARTLYSEGDLVKAKVLKVEVEARKINLGLKASYFVNAEEDDDEEEVEDEDLLDDEDGEGVELDLADASESDEGIAIDDAGEDEVDSEDESEADAMEIDGRKTKDSGLKTTGFDWTGDSLEPAADGAVSDAEVETSKSSKKRKKKPEIKEDLTGDLDKYGPRSNDDFERQLLGQPNDSQLWIQYMAFQLELSEVQKARDIAERALRTIHIRELEEKGNVWTARLNLEVEYGDEDNVEEVFKRACQVQDPLEMHEKLASIYISSGKLGKADAVFEAIAANKAFRASPTVWINYATFLMDTMKDASRARALLTRALQSIPISEHRQLTAKFAAMEFHSAAEGDPERGRTIFEGLISEWPKWTSGWDTFIDLERSRVALAESSEAKEAARGRVRALFERAVAQKMKQRRARFVFKKWLEFEEAEGNEKSASRVKALAKEFVERVQAGKDEEE